MAVIAGHLWPFDSELAWLPTGASVYMPAKEMCSAMVLV
jgi:hypothetical protein